MDWQRRRLLGRFPFEQTISRSRILALGPDSGTSALIHTQGMYDYNNMRFVQVLLRDSDSVFFDIGANIGSYTLIASEVTDARVLSFEPHPQTCEQLRANVALNGRANVETFQIALTDRDGPVFLTDSPGSAENFLVDSASGAVTVPGVAGRTFCASHPRPSVIKIDVEGFEHAVLAGFGELLARVSVLLIESNDLATERAGLGSRELDEALRKWGFAGPYRVDFNAGELLADSVGPEDPVWISESYAPHVTSALGFSVES